jgi:ABC-type multidrug transport system ATPase subunit
MEASGVAVRVGDRTILQPTSISVETGRLIGLIGPSGSGKSTLLRVLAGEFAPSQGDVTIGDVPLAQRTDQVGYVPFGDLLHGRLTVREALGYVAALRALPDSSDAERRARVDGVLDELVLSDRGDAFISTLSGGERRRAAVGIELLGHPSVLLLDEPATGLDARLERRLMETLRELANEDRAIVVATHATRSLELCDDIAVMGPDGRLRFFGPPAALLERFAIPAYERVYEALEIDSDGAASAPVTSTPHADAGGKALAPEYLAPLGTQAMILADRYRRVLLRDRRTLYVLLGQAPVIGLAIGLALPKQVLESSILEGYYGVILGFMLTIGSLWLGIISSCREIVKEQRIVLREAAIGVRLDAYLGAKCMVLFPLTAVQSILMLLCVALLQPLQVDIAGFGQLAVICVLTAWAAVALGLWVSAWARSADQATSTVPLIIIPQLLLAGAIIPIATMVSITKAVSVLAISRWSFAGLGSVLNLDGRLESAPSGGTGYDPDFFSRPASLPAITLIVFILAMLSLAGLQLERRIGRSQQGLIPEGG